MKIGPIRLFQTSEVRFKQLKSIVGVQQSTSFSLHLFITLTSFYLLNGIDILLGYVVDSQLVDSIDGVIKFLFVVAHFLEFSINVKGEDDVFAVSLSGSSFDLDVTLHAERCVK